MVIFVLVFHLSRQGFMFMAFRCWLSPSVLTFTGGTTLCNSPHLSDNTENSLSWVCVFNFELLFLVWVDLSSMCEDGVFSSDWWMRWPPPKSDLWGSPLLALPLLYLHLPPFAAPCLLLSHCGEGLWQKRQPDSWCGAEVEEGAGAFWRSPFTQKDLQLVVQSTLLLTRQRAYWQLQMVTKWTSNG